MHNYQTENYIKGMCLVNCRYFYKNILHNFPQSTARPAPVICVSGCKVIIHMVVIINDKIYDPSYEIFSLKDVKYFHSVKQYFDNNPPEFRLQLGPVVIKEFLNFIEFSKTLSSLVIDDEYYTALADYVEKEQVRGKCVKLN